MKTLLLVAPVIFLFAGCSKKVDTSCDFSAIKVKSIVLEGDLNGFAEDALAHELYARGAKSAESGIVLKGSVEYNTGRLVAMNFAAEGISVAVGASVVPDVKKDAIYLESAKELSAFEPAAEVVAKKAAQQVCECVTHSLTGSGK